MGAENLARIEFLDIREVWPNEATSFTPWLLENQDVLADCLGIELELNDNEHPIGNFSLDLIGKNLTDGTVLIVENQLERTDHTHLGQLITYAGGLGPSTIVWIAREFRDEHIAALDWLNEETGEDTLFFGIEIRAIRIESSAPAPWLQLVVKPNEWVATGHQVSREKTLNEKDKLRREFWSEFLDTYRNSSPIYKRKQAPSKQWMSWGISLSESWIGINIRDDQVYGDIYFSDKDSSINLQRLRNLEAKKVEIEAIFGDSLTFEEVPGKKYMNARLGFYGSGSLLDRSTWPEAMHWLNDVAHRLREVTESEVFKKATDV